MRQIPHGALVLTKEFSFKNFLKKKIKKLKKVVDKQK